MDQKYLFFSGTFPQRNCGVPMIMIVAKLPGLERSKVINHSMMQLQMPNSSLFALLQPCNSQAKNLNFCPGLGTLDGVQSDIDKKGDVEALSSQIHTYK